MGRNLPCVRLCRQGMSTERAGLAYHWRGCGQMEETLMAEVLLISQSRPNSRPNSLLQTRSGMIKQEIHEYLSSISLSDLLWSTSFSGSGLCLLRPLPTSLSFPPPPGSLSKTTIAEKAALGEPNYVGWIKSFYRLYLPDGHRPDVEPQVLPPTQ